MAIPAVDPPTDSPAIPGGPLRSFFENNEPNPVASDGGAGGASELRKASGT